MFDQATKTIYMAKVQAGLGQGVFTAEEASLMDAALGSHQTVTTIQTASAAINWTTLLPQLFPAISAALAILIPGGGPVLSLLSALAALFGFSLPISPTPAPAPVPGIIPAPTA